MAGDDGTTRCMRAPLNLSSPVAGCDAVAGSWLVGGSCWRRSLTVVVVSGVSFSGSLSLEKRRECNTLSGWKPNRDLRMLVKVRSENMA